MISMHTKGYAKEDEGITNGKQGYAAEDRDIAANRRRQDTSQLSTTEDKEASPKQKQGRDGKPAPLLRATLALPPTV